jgi:hypothetical protein
MRQLQLTIGDAVSLYFDLRSSWLAEPDGSAKQYAIAEAMAELKRILKVNGVRFDDEIFHDQVGDEGRKIVAAFRDREYAEIRLHRR